MSKHRHHEECCYPVCGPMGGGYSMGGYGGTGIRWFYALLILIVIVLQFGRRKKVESGLEKDGCEGFAVADKGDDQIIDSSILFIIVVFLLVLCAGCWFGGSNNYGYGGYGF
ncbi:hypothetical protein OXPF_07090 [Oxobacter pfennigii]|uniref:Uncharacterized protein n=1 Tax=Oxobacter pfennigii TaxID=36849 RepID=A0A0P8WCK2_9CLOT|nr:hypothetical protein [Oxobacter pfennigii]KPU45476.1 hypothetical protein OXPF_07090 [Oxobacter pfennigii]